MAYPHFTDEEAENWKSLDTRIDSQGNWRNWIPDSGLPTFWPLHWCAVKSGAIFFIFKIFIGVWLINNGVLASGV